MEDLDALYRAHARRLMARLVRLAAGRVDCAEAAVHDAFVEAATAFESSWPDRPEAWLYRVARNRLTDVLRREQVGRRVEEELDERYDEAAAPVDVTFAGEWDDELLRMIVAVCQPTLTKDEQVALALRILCGVSRSSIARIFLAQEETIKKRLTNAKKKLRTRSIDAPLPVQAAERIPAAMRVLYVVFTEGHKPRSGDDALRVDLCVDAIRMAEVLERTVPEHRAELHALLALMKLVAARLPARLDGDRVVLLEHQDRDRWDRRRIDEGLVHLQKSAGGRLTAYHHEATIAACHSLASDFESTDWGRIVRCYDALLAERPSVTLEVNRAVAVGFHESYERGVSLLLEIPRETVVGYLPYHAALASLLERAGDATRAASAYQVAANLSRVQADRDFFEARLRALAS